MLVGKIRDNFDLLQAEKLPFEELPRKVSEQARSNMVDTDVCRGKVEVAVGSQQPCCDYIHQGPQGTICMNAFHRNGAQVGAEG